ncbi:TetR/AcrR family transcriptional regulator [Mucilaginibacter gotjawali]|uniref:AcrR family transcriptional regulator n=2 Tax=Mucilaginibacter gotjawali TaxID=1550579 RepID=A0A839SGC7_9SPHI|nr:TetR/AcrR family transcriptional regulator [Mucilaginibacter gotjawali]MBB3056382.1 AcrR family transcriptional regulator [Mucilaginibacter gotjawali]BAU55089.1 putative HTH-type transcriptional regulator YttP [Mucilaginibacter gotjawali]
MDKPGNITNPDASTEEKIKEAARVVFTAKGYAATTVRDIAAQANINLALVNYYFRSKEKLFDLIMAETMKILFDKIKPVIYDESTTLNEKISGIVDSYLELLLENPELPLFVVSEMRSGSDMLPKMTENGKLFLESHFAKQIRQLQAKGQLNFHPVNIMMNMLGLIVFPFIGRPLMLKTGIVNEEEFRKIIEERKKLIPLWIVSIINL